MTVIDECRRPPTVREAIVAILDAYGPMDVGRLANYLGLDHPEGRNVTGWWLNGTVNHALRQLVLGKKIEFMYDDETQQIGHYRLCEN